MIERAEYPYSGVPPQPRQATTVRSATLTRSPIVARRPGPPLHVHDVDVTFPEGLDPAALTWDEWHSSYGAVVDTDDSLYERCRFTTLGDGISDQGRRPIIRECWFDDIYDDAIQLDHKHPATIEGCVLDGVHVAFSARSSVVRADPGVVTIRDTWVRLRPQHQSFRPDRYGHDQHGPFFKWDANAPAVHLDNVTLAAYQPSAYGGGLGPPPRCTGTTVTLVGVDAWPMRDVAAWQSLEDAGAIELVRLVDEWAPPASHPAAPVHPVTDGEPESP